MWWVLSILYYPILAIFVIKCFIKLVYRPCRSKVSLVGKTAIVTGGNRGIGFEISLGLASRGCKVIIACRSDAEKAKQDIIRRTHNTNIVVKHLDLTSLESVRKFCKEIHGTEEKIDILMNNAGTSCEENKYTKDGLHPTMQANLFGSFLLTHLLIDLMKKAGNARIVFTSSVLSLFNNLTLETLNPDEGKPITTWRTLRIYANSKMGQIIVSKELAERLKPFGITSNAVHPGIIKTSIFNKPATILSACTGMFFWLLFHLFFKTPEEGAQRPLKLAMSNAYKDVSGIVLFNFIWDINIISAKNGEFRRKIWKRMEDYVHLEEKEKIKTL